MQDATKQVIERELGMAETAAKAAAADALMHEETARMHEETAREYRAKEQRYWDVAADLRDLLKGAQ